MTDRPDTGEDLSEFGRALASLVSKEIIAARREPSRYVDITESLAANLGFTIAFATGGNGDLISEIVAGTEAYIMEAAAEKAPAARVLGTAMRRKRP